MLKSQNCLVISDSSNFFLVGNRYLNLSNEKISDRYFDFSFFNKKIKHLATNIAFLENFIFYLRMLNVITSETENFFKIIYKLKNNIYNLSYNSNNTRRFFILSNEQYKILNNMYERIYLSYRKVRKLLISTGYFHLLLFQNIAIQMKNAADVNVNYIFQNITHLY